MGRTLVITNDFPPRPGGIQSFVHGLVSRLPSDSVVVMTSAWRGSQEFDQAQDFPVVRVKSKVLLPGPRAKRLATELMKQYDCDRVLFGASAPLGMMAPALRKAGAVRCIGITHGHEAGWTRWPIARQVIKSLGTRLDAMTYLGEYTRSAIADAIGPQRATRLVQLTPGVDPDMFSPDIDGSAVRERYDLGQRPVIVCVSRLMPRKGQDVLIEAMPSVLAKVPTAALLIVGGGPHKQKLMKKVSELGLTTSVIITGSVPWDQLPAHYAAGDVFAMPCRTRLRGLDVEGLGIVYLEASATGLPVIGGRSGGAPDAVLEGVTGHSVDGNDAAGLTAIVIELLTDHAKAGQMGQEGRAWVQEKWTWSTQMDKLAAILAD